MQTEELIVCTNDDCGDDSCDCDADFTSSFLRGLTFTPSPSCDWFPDEVLEGKFGEWGVVTATERDTATGRNTDYDYAVRRGFWENKIKLTVRMSKTGRGSAGSFWNAVKNDKGWAYKEKNVRYLGKTQNRGEEEYGLDYSE